MDNNMHMPSHHLIFSPSTTISCWSVCSCVVFWLKECRIIARCQARVANRVKALHIQYSTVNRCIMGTMYSRARKGWMMVRLQMDDEDFRP